MVKKHLYKNLFFCFTLLIFLSKSVRMAYSESVQDASSKAIAERLLYSIFDSNLPNEFELLVLTPKPQFTLQKSDESNLENIQKSLIKNFNTYSGITAFSDSDAEEKIFLMLNSTSVNRKTKEEFETILERTKYAAISTIHKSNGAFYLWISFFNLETLERLAFAKSANYETLQALYSDFGATEEVVSSLCRTLKFDQTEIADFSSGADSENLEDNTERLQLSSDADAAYGRGEYKEALKLFKKAANKGDSYALKRCGDMYFLGEGTGKSYSSALSYYKKAAAKNNVEAQTILGIMYENGFGTKQNYAFAAIWYERASRKNAVAQNNLGVMYENAKGLVQDYNKAFSLYSSAAKKGIVEANNNLGVLFETGRGTVADAAKAFELYKEAADKGNLEALCNLAILFETGKGTTQNYNQAANYYKQASDLGSTIAQNNLGILYNNGRGVSRDVKQAKSLWESAKKQGDILAANNLSLLNGESKTAVSGYSRAEVGYTNGTSSSIKEITLVSNANFENAKEEASDAEK